MNQKGNKKTGGALKRFVGNKNTVTVLGFLSCIVILIIGYTTRVNKAISPIAIPYAKQTIPARTLVTNEMIGKIKIASSYVSAANNLVKNQKEVVGKYVSYKTSIPKGSLFYTSSLKEDEEMPDHAFKNIDEGYTIFSLAVNKESTYANSIRAGDYIDLYMAATYSEGDQTRTIYGCLIKSIRVLAVKDDDGENIIKNTLAYGDPSELLFAVSSTEDNNMFALLMESQWIGSSVELIPVIYNKNYTTSHGETNVNSQDLKQFILAKTKTFEEVVG